MRPPALFAIILLAACQGDDMSPNNDLFVTGGECTAVSWADGPLVQSCEQETEGSEWECACSEGSNHEPNRDSDCRDALQAACGTTDAALEGCAEDDVGICVVGENGGWACACEGESALTSASAETCTSALWHHCGPSCSTTDISCSPGATLYSYTCQCEALDEERGVGTAEACDDAFRVCEPDSGYDCMHEGGSCDEGRDGYICECADGSTGSISYQEVGDDCGYAVDQVCSPN